VRSKVAWLGPDPSIFNRSIKENMLYGKLTASNADILKVIEVAGATEFTESSLMEQAFDEHNVKSLREAFVSAGLVSKVKERIGSEIKFTKQLETLRELEAQEEALQGLEPIAWKLDRRSDNEKGSESLPLTYNLTCG